MSNPGKVSHNFQQYDLVEGTARFMDAANQLLFTGLSSNVKDPDRVKRRAMLAGKDEGEVGEYLDAEFANDPVEMADGLADIAVIAVGTLFKYFGEDCGKDIIAEVVRSNDDKVNGTHGPTVFSEDGLKVLKPKGWVAPDIAGVLRAHGFAFMPSNQTYIPFDSVEVDEDGGK